MASVPNNTVETVIKSLKRNRFRVEHVESIASATKAVLEMIPLNAKVGVPGTTTVRQLGIVGLLRKRGTNVLDLAQVKESLRGELMRQLLRCDILLASTNALTLDGKLVNIDLYGNRVAGMIFGPKRVLLVIGINKIVRDVDEAVKRIKNVIAPYHAMARGSKTPCTTTGHCSDCNSPERICNVTTIIEKKPWSTDMAILLVGADLGLGWNPDWPRERIEKITLTYRETRKSYY